MLQNSNFPGLCPGPRWGSLQRSPDPLTDGEAAGCPSQEPHPALDPLGLVSTGLRVEHITELTILLMIDFKACRPV